MAKKKNCESLPQKNCFYLQYVIQHVKKSIPLCWKYKQPSVRDVFSSTSSNAKPMQYPLNHFKVLAWKTKLYALCCVYIHIISPSNFFAASLSTYGDDIWNIGIGTVQPPNRRHWQIIHYINGSFVWIWEISPKKILLAFSQITKKKEAIALFRSLGIRFQKTFFSFCVLLKSKSFEIAKMVVFVRVYMYIL